MIRAMYSGISGMKVNQTKLDVTGNNIANVGTTGFKGSRVRFQDMLSQNVSEALGPGRNTGGVNGRQVGLGVQVAGIDTVVTQGMMQPTSRNLDAAVDGEGYFVVAKGPIPQSNAQGISVDANDHTMSGGNLEVSYTRDGAFTLDHAGNLLTSDGYRVMGYSLMEKGNTDKLSIDYDSNGAVNFIDADAKDGLEASGNLVPLRIPDSIYVKATKVGADPLNVYMDFIGSGAKEVITGEPKIDTNGKAFEGENDLNLKINYVKKDDGAGNVTYEPKLFVNGEQILGADGKPLDTIPSPLTVAEMEAHFKGKNGWDKETDTTKKDALEKEAQEKAKQIMGKSEINITTPASSLDPTDKENTKYSWSFTVKAEGYKKVRSFSMEKDGVIKAVLDDGSVSALGQIALTSFKNPGGLKKLGKNLYQNTSNSGQPVIRSGVGGPANLDNSDGYGEILQGMLEMSNVDLAEQFTDMIVTTRAFQASGKMITTGDEILQDIINLKR